MVPVNFSDSSQGNTTWVYSCNHEHKEEIEEDTICCTRRRGRYHFAKIYFLGQVSVITDSDFFISWIQRLFIQQYQIELLGTEVDLSDTNQQQGRYTRPKHHTYKDHIYLDRLLLLSNLTWRRAHVTPGFSLRTKSWTYGDCNAILLFTSRKKSQLLFCFRDMFTHRVLVYQDKWFVSV